MMIKELIQELKKYGENTKVRMWVGNEEMPLECIQTGLQLISEVHEDDATDIKKDAIYFCYYN